MWTAAAVAIVLSGCLDERRPPRRAINRPADAPTIVVYVIDTLRRDRLQPYGYGRPTSGRIEELSRECTVFDRAHAPAPWTLPSVVSMLTSQDPLAHGVVMRGQRIDAATRPLAERLRDAGWRTGCFVDNPFAGSASGLDRGCDHYERSHRKRVDAALVGSWLDAAPGPAFLYLHSTEPHRPFRAPRRFLDALGGVSRRERHQLERRLRIYRRLTTVGFLREGSVSPERTDHLLSALHGELVESRDTFSRVYDAQVAWADETVGTIVDALRERGRWRSTLFILTSDHGEELLDHGDVMHGQSLYAELVRVPLIVCDPRRSGPRSVQTTVTLLDVMPTVLARAAVSGDGLAGRDLTSLAAAERAAPRVTSVRVNRHLESRRSEEARGNLNVAVDDGRWRAIWNVDHDVIELYDTRADAAEQFDSAADHPEQVAALAAFARDWAAGRWPDDTRRQTADVSGLREETVARLRKLGYVP